MSRIADLVTQVQDHWQHELSKAVEVIAETGRERNALQAELEQAHATLTAAMEGRQWQLERAVQAEAEVARLNQRIAYHHCDPFGLVHELNTSLAAAEAEVARLRAAAICGDGQTSWQCVFCFSRADARDDVEHEEDCAMRGEAAG